MTYSDKFLDTHRNINVDDSDWWSYVEDMWKEKLSERGIEVTAIFFSGFWSQGDGACFEGYIRDYNTFMRAHQLAEEYPLLNEVAGHVDWTVAEWKHFGTYYHERSLECMHSNASAEEYLEGVYDLPLLREMGGPILERCENELTALAGHIEDIVQEYCVEIYHSLQEEYDYLTSDEAVAETLEINDIQEDDYDDK